MRIGSGIYKGRVIKAVEGAVTRPTSDKVRHAMMNKLRSLRMGEDWSEWHVLDAFAGSGALGIEALSNGAHSTCDFFEQDKRAHRQLNENLKIIEDPDRYRLFQKDSLRYFSNHKCDEGQKAYDLIFMDPPYGRQLGASLLDVLASNGWLAPQALIVVEADQNSPEPIDAARFECLSEKSYGRILVRYYCPKS